MPDRTDLENRWHQQNQQAPATPNPQSTGTTSPPVVARRGPTGSKGNRYLEQLEEKKRSKKLSVLSIIALVLIGLQCLSLFALVAVGLIAGFTTGSEAFDGIRELLSQLEGYEGEFTQAAGVAFATQWAIYLLFGIIAFIGTLKRVRLWTIIVLVLLTLGLIGKGHIPFFPVVAIILLAIPQRKTPKA